MPVSANFFLGGGNSEDITVDDGKVTAGTLNILNMPISLHTNNGCGKVKRILVGDLPRQHPFGTTLRFTGPVPADSRQ